MTDNQQPQRNPWDPPEDATAAPQQDSQASTEHSFGSENPYTARANNDSPDSAHQAPSYGAPSYGSAHNSAAPAPSYGSANSNDPYGSSSYGSFSFNSSPFDAHSASSAQSAHSANSANSASSPFSAASAPAAPAGGATQGAPVPAGEPAPGTDIGNDLGKSLSWAFSAFGKNLGPFLIPTIVWAVIISVVSIIFIVGYVRALFSLENNGYLGTGNFIAILVGFFLMIVFALLWASGAINVAGIIARGEKPSISSGFLGGRALITAIVVGIIVSIGYVLLILPGIILTILLLFAPYAATTDKLGVGAALKASVDVVKSNLGLAILTCIVASLITSVVSATVIGVLVVIPVSALYYTASYMRGSGRIPAEAK